MRFSAFVVEKLTALCYAQHGRSVKNMTNQKIGTFIATLRKEQGLTQEQLAEKLGVSNRSVSRWENGKTLPDFSIMQALSDVLGVSLAELFCGRRSDDTRPEDAITIALELSQKENEQLRKQLNLRFGCGFSFLLLAALDIPAIVSPAFGTVLFRFCFTLGFGFIVAGFYGSCKPQTAAKSRIAVLAIAESDLHMRTAEELLQFSMKYQDGHKRQHAMVFHEIAQQLQHDEYAVFSFIGNSCTVGGNPGPWHIGVAVTNKRLLLSGETMRGCMLPVYPVHSYDRASLKSIYLQGSNLVLCIGELSLKLDGTSPAGIFEKLKSILFTKI